jgi:hypothetical protein
MRAEGLRFRNLFVIFLRLSGLLRGSSQKTELDQTNSWRIHPAGFAQLDAGSGRGPVMCQRQ